ncbi:MAG TPA: ATPase, T2SS/T4P/T4SS family, partial [Verrucomicrobiae bacterium]|nr:ATPase, T2SS/T4P/T4SS family [Verrucomicrobiae bacterium]
MDLGFVTAAQVEAARAEAATSGVGVVDLMVANKLIRPADVAQAKAAHFGAEVVNLADLRLADDVISLIRRDIAKKYRVVPVSKMGNTITVAVSDPSDLDTLDSLHHLLHADIEPKVASEQDIESALNKYYGGRALADNSAMQATIQELTQADVAVTGDDEEEAVDADAPIIKLVNSLISEAFRLRASDIHLEPLSKVFRVRYRIDGVMVEMKSPPKRLQPAIIARLKIQSNMSIAEHRIPQDGRINTKVGNKFIDLRVSCLPTNHGESIVMRILDKEGLRLGLPELGFFTDDQQTFEKL